MGLFLETVSHVQGNDQKNKGRLWKVLNAFQTLIAL
jgi:hypothetical protein